MAYVRQVVAAALAEDVGPGDVTTLATIPAAATCRAQLRTRVAGIAAGLPVAIETFRQLDPSLEMTEHRRDGEPMDAGDLLLTIAGPARPVLTAERVALNFSQRLSGIATLTRRYVEAVQQTKAVIVDTRKTTPALRRLEKYAVRAGGGRNHRFGLFDGVLIKDNHISASPDGVGGAILAARRAVPHSLRIEVECDDLDQVREAVEAGADAILLDNMPPDQLRRAVELIAGRAIAEASGGITLANVREVAETGVDLISVGALTHSAPSLDLGLDFSLEGV
ncbi:MAG: carboxylating nicotinate-nucleotide diphosphorylase [Chloroflexi bacterium]|nr:carboxylating nicotinate-nucleotide diphosphorylase [Chloroflexota bacterium]